MEPEWNTFGDDAAVRTGPNTMCGVARMLADHIPEQHRAAVRRHIEDPAYQASSVARALKDRLGDRAPTYNIIKVHRQGVCSCKRTDST